VVVRAVAACLGLPERRPDVQRRAYILWSFVHGHSFLTIDMKHKVARDRDGAYLMIEKGDEARWGTRRETSDGRVRRAIAPIRRHPAKGRSRIVGPAIGPVLAEPIPESGPNGFARRAGLGRFSGVEAL
jgi:hypothetical protein